MDLATEVMVMIVILRPLEAKRFENWRTGLISKPPEKTTFSSVLFLCLLQFPSNNNCGYAFMGDQDSFQYSYLSVFSDPNFLSRVPIVLDYAIGTQSCAVANNSNAYLCNPKNTLCSDNTDSSGYGGYLCNCKYGYEGNPYLSPGCIGLSLAFCFSNS
ncbi:hypothetical protein RHSIM_Rhsim04G0101600 [Rhododendron simsii]|uniref:Uncharacterized protein n=1 Tax=Rhododendron simsii TaxID=118357 RepID=A0A834H5B8_RHOSS|nr:hypothetical protein RHSIM_Rhsim04G0101600 [Rhododendron simsii]